MLAKPQLIGFDKPAYTYSIQEIVKYVDGDTIDVILDLGFNISIKRRVRLYGINTPESRTRDLEEKRRGKAATARLQELCEFIHNGDVNLILKCHGLGKYGRVLGEIFNHNTSANLTLVTEGHAVEYYGGKR